MSPADADTVPRSILIIGGSGYLGRFLIQAFHDEGWSVSYTYCSSESESARLDVSEDVVGRRVDLVSGQGLAAAVREQTVDVVINCAALSSPDECEKDEEKARAVNVPTRLLEQLEEVAKEGKRRPPPVLIHLSTDHVYDGSKKSFWTEDDGCEPVNAYGRTKLEAEERIRRGWREHYILRSSIIYGPEIPPGGLPVGRRLFVQFVDDAFRRNEGPISLFDDEWRCPIYVYDIVHVCMALAGGRDCPPRVEYGVFCMGGPERLSRVDMGERIARCRGYHTNTTLTISSPVLSAEEEEKLDQGTRVIHACSASSVRRRCASPSDISMSSAKLASALPQWKPTPFAEGVARIFASSCSPSSSP